MFKSDPSRSRKGIAFTPECLSPPLSGETVGDSFSKMTPSQGILRKKVQASIEEDRLSDITRVTAYLPHDILQTNRIADEDSEDVADELNFLYASVDPPPIRKNNDSFSVYKEIVSFLRYSRGVDPHEATTLDFVDAVSNLVRSRSLSIKADSSPEPFETAFIAYNFGFDALIATALRALGLYNETKEGLAKLKVDLEELLMTMACNSPVSQCANLCHDIVEAATNFYHSGVLYSLQFKFGNFFQVIDPSDQSQKEIPQTINYMDMLTPIQKRTYQVRLYGTTEEDTEGHHRLMGGQLARTQMNELLIPSWRTNKVFPVRFIKSVPSPVLESDLASLSYDDRLYNKINATNITDSPCAYNDIVKHEMLLKQGLLLAVSSVSDIIRDARDIRRLPRIVCFDGITALVSIELLRVLLDDHFLPWHDAMSIVRQSVVFSLNSYLCLNNSFSVQSMGYIMPRHLEIIEHLNHLFLSKVRDSAWTRSLMSSIQKMSEKVQFRLSEIVSQDGVHPQAVRTLSVFQEGPVKRTRLYIAAVLASRSLITTCDFHLVVVSNRDLRHHYSLASDRFRVVTNGVSVRKWVITFNPTLTAVISKSIGEEWQQDARELSRLYDIASSSDLQIEFRGALIASKIRLMSWLNKRSNVKLPSNTPSCFIVSMLTGFCNYRGWLVLSISLLILDYEKKLVEALDKPVLVLCGGNADPNDNRGKMLVKFVQRVFQLIKSPKIEARFVNNATIDTQANIISASDVYVQISEPGTEACGLGALRASMNGAHCILGIDGINEALSQTIQFHDKIKGSESLLINPEELFDKLKPQFSVVFNSLLTDAVLDEEIFRQANALALSIINKVNHSQNKSLWAEERIKIVSLAGLHFSSDAYFLRLTETLQ